MRHKDISLHDGESGSALAIRLNPLADRNEVSKVFDDGTIEVKLEGVGDNLNEQLRNFLSQLLQVSKKRINIVAGQSKMEKLVSIIDMEPHQVQKIILKHLK